MITWVLIMQGLYTIVSNLGECVSVRPYGDSESEMENKPQL